MTEPHSLEISKGVGVADTTWFWICRTHGYRTGWWAARCPGHMSVFMTQQRTRQLRLI